ncbi:hypothetical protein [Sinirhodobacter huangdaonensis]|uniref:Uncharacterized protein n=1 Tax=Paenirhodobacter huangdaonensis TaxID=2501515 RepID=A0A3S3PHB7_9RHOB|nr:hypothetical protein [Sinirhodobacter huangdaonensis]RWR54885.1 hypothetical protein EOW66_02125 [Sinirhodobacter huangdaonensis]
MSRRVGFDDVAVRDVAGRTIILRLGFRAYLAYEAETGESAFAAVARFERGEMTRITDLAQIVHAAALQHQPDYTLGNAADLLERHPDLIARCLRASLPTEIRDEDRKKKRQTAPWLQWLTCWMRG